MGLFYVVLVSVNLKLFFVSQPWWLTFVFRSPPPPKHHHKKASYGPDYSSLAGNELSAPESHSSDEAINREAMQHNFVLQSYTYLLEVDQLPIEGKSHSP